jgi:hypothetical protein
VLSRAGVHGEECVCLGRPDERWYFAERELIVDWMETRPFG